MPMPQVSLVILTVVITAGIITLKKKGLHLWILPYLGQRFALLRKRDIQTPTHIIFCLADHFEPRWENPAYEVECARVNAWVQRYPQIAQKFRDADGKFPQHTFFYPAEEYRPEHLEKLADLCKRGFGEIEIHLHHENDTSCGFKEKLILYKNQLMQHGLLSTDNAGHLRYGFIHGNWALDNSRKNGKFCGVNNELTILKETGCYADFTLPAAPSEAQTKKINSIYYAHDNPDRPKSHNTGIAVEAGARPANDGLMIIQGPLTLNWKRRKWRVFPRIENGEISAKNPPTKERVDLWIKQHIHVKGRPDWVFVKVHIHGAQKMNLDIFLWEKFEEMFSYLTDKYNDGKNYVLHYVTARQMYNIIKAAEDGLNGNPKEYRDYILKRKC